MKCRKLLAILLALVMVIGLLPFAALAEEVPGSSPGDEVSDKIVADQNDPLPEGDPLGEQPPEVSLLNNEHHAGATALKSTDSELFDGSYYLSEDVKLNKPVKFSGTATLCLNGHKLSCGSDKVITVDGTLTICDCADGGKIEATDRANFVINVGTGKTLNVVGGTICGGSRGISGSLNSEINISGGTIQKSASSRYKALELTGTTATITGGTISGGVELKSFSKLSLGGTPTVDTIKLTHTSCSINATADSEPYSGGSITIDYGDLDYSDGAAIVSGVTEENAESFIVTPPKGMVVKFDNGNLVFGEPSTAPGHKNHGANGTGTITGEWQAWNPQTIKTLDDGYYYLDQNYDNLKAITVTGDAYLCLNGHEMSDNGRDAKFIIVNSGASLTICDCSKDKPGRINYKCETGCAIDNKGALKLYSGTIYSDVGNGIYIMSNDGSDVNFDMEGGTIDVGGIGIYFSIGTGVNIKGGTLTYGGQTGVRFAAEGTLTVSRGTIQPRDDGYKKSEGISKIDAGDLYVTGGKISGKQYGIQIANAGDGEVEISGGNISASGEEGYGIYLSKSATANLYLRDTPTISGQEAALNIGKPNAVYASKNGQPYIGDNLTVAFTGNDTEAPIILDVNNNAGKFTLVFPTDKILKQVGNNLVLGTKDVGHQDHDANGEGELPIDAEWIEWDGSAFTEAGYYYLNENITLDSSITIREDINLCLNGCTISRTGGNEVFKVTGGTFTICDCATEPGSISYSGSSYGAAVNMTRGTLNLYRVTLSGGPGSGITMIGSNTKANVYSGTISGSGSKGALNISGSKAYLVGGSISGNIQLQNRAELNLGNTSITGTVNLRSSGTAAGYLSTINASANDVSYSGDKITITTNDENVPAGTVIVHKVTDKNAASFELRDYQLTRNGDTLVVGDNSMDFDINVEIPDGGITYGAIDPDGYPVSVTFTGGKPEDVELRYQVEGTSKLYQATIEENQADQTKATLYPTTAGDFTITVTATAQGYNETIKTVTVEVIKPKLTITAKDQVLIAGGTIVESLEQIIVEGNTVNGDELTGIGLLLIKNDQNEPKFIEPHTAVITNENNSVPEANVSFCYDITYIDGKVVDHLPDQEMPRLSVTVTPSSLTYGQTAWARVSGAPNGVDVTYIYSIVGSDGIATINEQTGEITATGIGTFQVKVVASADGYTDGEAISEVITVNRATSTPEEVPSLTATYGDTLADIDLPTGWTWKNPKTSVDDVGTHKFEAVYQETPEEYYIPVTVELSVEVTPKSISGASIVLGASLTYTGEELTQTVAGVSVDGVNLDPQDYAVTNNKATDAGTYTLTITGTGNYTGTATKQWSIAEAASVVITEPTAKTGLKYTGTAQALIKEGTASGGTMVYSLEEGGAYTTNLPQGTNAGDYTVWYKVEGDKNHIDTTPVEIPVSIGKANLTVTADNKQNYEGSPDPTYTASYSGFVNNETKDVLSGELEFTCSYTQNSKPGTYPITPSGLTSDNYAITFQNGTLTVVAVGEILPPVAKDLTYTGKAQKLIDPAQAADDVDLFYSLDLQHFYRTIPEATNAGTYTVYWEAEKDGTTVDNGSLTVTIKKAPLTVTADDIWVYAGNTPKFTVTITGYVNGEDWRELGGKLTFTCGYSEKYSKPGSRYTITPKGLRADNYDITFETGILTVKDPLSPRFNVYVLDSKHGTVEADCRYARKGDVVTLTIKPDWGYELETLTVTDSHGYELKLTYHSNDTYTFTMPRDNVTVKAIFTVRDMPFVDVPGDAWYAGGVRYVYAHGLMNGTGSWRFSPNRTTTRAMIATILYRMEGSPRVYGTSQFGDVEAGSWYEDAVIWATQNDIVEGYTSKTFGPNDPITREQMAAMLYRYADYCRCDMSAGRYVDLSKFSDMNEISDYAIPALRWAVGEEIIQGRTGKRLAPTDTATRAEVAVMLMRFCEDVIW